MMTFFKACGFFFKIVETQGNKRFLILTLCFLCFHE